MTDVGTAALAITQGVAAFNSFLPPLSEVRKGSVDNPEFAGDVRMGEIAACALTVGVGTIVSSLTGDPVPVYVAVVVSIGLVIMYETTLRKDRPMEAKAHHLYRVQGPETITNTEASA